MCTVRYDHPGGMRVMNGYTRSPEASATAVEVRGLPLHVAGVGGHYLYADNITSVIRNQDTTSGVLHQMINDRGVRGRGCGHVGTAE